MRNTLTVTEFHESILLRPDRRAETMLAELKASLDKPDNFKYVYCVDIDLDDATTEIAIYAKETK